jgi:hypothetical protein
MLRPKTSCICLPAFCSSVQFVQFVKNVAASGIRSGEVNSRLKKQVERLGHRRARPTIEIQSLISAGNLDGMHWPNFRDYQPWLQRFYQPGGYAPAWIQANATSPQALTMIELFRNAWQKGLEIKTLRDWK